MTDWKENILKSIKAGVIPWSVLGDPEVMDILDIPFSWMGQETSRLMHPSEWGSMPIAGGWGVKSPFLTKEKQSIGEQFESILPGGEGYEKYQEKPMWEKLAWEAPAMLFPVGGAAKTALKPTLKLAKAKPMVKATESVVEKLAKPVEPIADPIISKLKNLIGTHKEAGKITKNLRKIELGRRTRIAQDIYNRVLKQTGDIDKAKSASLSVIKGKMPTETVINPKDFLTTKEFTGLRMKIAEFVNPLTQKPLFYFEKINADTALNKLLATEEALKPWEIKLLERVFPDIGELVTLKAKMGGQAFYTLMDTLNIPRALLASGDVSGIGRQGAILLARFPGEVPGTVKASLKTIFSPKSWRQIDGAIQTEMKEMVTAHPDIPHLQSAIERVYQAIEPGKIGSLAGKEEMFQTTLLYRLPVIKQTIGQFVKASERSFTSGLNYLRWKSTKNYLNLFIKNGATSENDLYGIAELVNAASGRGSLEAVGKVLGAERMFVTSSPLLNALFFAPRLVISRFEPFAMMFNPATTPAVRKEAVRTMVQFLGAGTSILTMAKLGGAEIETDPRSSDFAKIKIGNTRLDIWAGYVQWARFAAQVTTEERKITGSGRIQDVNRADIVWRLMQSKGSPLASIMVDLLQGETFLGEEMFPVTKETTMRELRNRLTPLFAQDLWDALEIDGLVGLAAAFPGAVGAGVVTYEQNPIQELGGSVGEKVSSKIP